jgi:hypothetical protein
MVAELFEYEGVGVAIRHGLLTVVYAADARAHRSAWVFDRAEEILAEHDHVYCLLIVDTKQGLPDAATRAENARRFRKAGTKLRFLVMVPLGDPLRVILVKAVLRTMVLVLGDSDRHCIAASEADGILKIRKAMGTDAPPKEELEDDLIGIRELLRGSLTMRRVEAV